MSNRTLIEINHDFAGEVDKAPTGNFERLLLSYLRSASKESARELEHFGVTVLGMRHHSERFTEKVDAVILANKILDRVNADPDDELAVLARQFLRARETAA